MVLWVVGKWWRWLSVWVVFFVLFFLIKKWGVLGSSNMLKKRIRDYVSWMVIGIWYEFVLFFFEVVLLMIVVRSSLIVIVYWYEFMMMLWIYFGVVLDWYNGIIIC